MANGNGNKNTTANIGFEQQIWAAADILRGNMDAAVIGQCEMWTDG